MVPPPLDEQIIVSATWPHRQQAGTYTVQYIEGTGRLYVQYTMCPVTFTQF